MKVQICVVLVIASIVAIVSGVKGRASVNEEVVAELLLTSEHECQVVCVSVTSTPIITLAPTLSPTPTAAVSANEVDGITGKLEEILTLMSLKEKSLNEQAYEEAARIFNTRHVSKCYGTPKTILGQSYVEFLNPYMPLAISACETGCWTNTKDAWVPVVYTIPLEGLVDFNTLDITQLGTEFYAELGLYEYINCGSNCKADKSVHYHTGNGLNDNDSLGSMQILRRHLGTKGSIKFNCCEITDLMRWDSGCQYIFHKSLGYMTDSSTWNNTHKIDNEYEAMALTAIMHNTGCGFVAAKSGSGVAGGTWRNAQAVYDLAEDLSSVKAMTVFHKYISAWYEDAQQLIEQGQNFRYPGVLTSDEWNRLLGDAGIDLKEYATTVTHKQFYPVVALLNYMGLKKLYGGV